MRTFIYKKINDTLQILTSYKKFLGVIVNIRN